MSTRTAQPTEVNGIKVGDVFYRSWGYDQTNINFYKVVALTAKRIKIQEIGKKTVYDEGGSTTRVVADLDSAPFGEVMVKTVQRIVGISLAQILEIEPRPEDVLQRAVVQVLGQAAPLTLLDAHQLSQQARSVRRELTYRQHAGALDRGEPHGSGR